MTGWKWGTEPQAYQKTKQKQKQKNKNKNKKQKTQNPAFAYLGEYSRIKLRGGVNPKFFETYRVL